MNEAKKSRLRSWEPYIYLVIVTAAAVSIGLLVRGFVHQQHQARHLAAEIQRQRIEGILRQCRSQNERHDTAHAYLNELLKKSGVSAKRRKDSQVQVGGFIDALAPKRNCKALAHLQVTSPPKAAPRKTTTQSSADN